MKNVIAFFLVGSLALGGCKRRADNDLPTPNERVYAFIRALETNSSAKVIFASAAIRTNLQVLATREERQRLISDWTDALLHTEVERLPSAERISSIGIALRLLDVDAYWLMRDTGADCGALWDYRFRVLDWLDEHISQMNPEKTRLADNENDERRKWWNYLFLIEKRENLIEGWENVAFDPLAYDSGAEELEGIRRRFEQRIGRAVRKDNTSQGVGAILSEVRKNVMRKEKIALEAIREKGASGGMGRRR